MPVRRKRMRWSRNWPCLCGSGIKYKFCCMGEIDNITISDGNASVDKLSDDIQTLINNQQQIQKSGGAKSHE